MIDPPKHLTGLPLILSAIALSLATFVIVLDYSIANISIPYIAGDLAISPNEGIYVITSFAVGSAIVLPLSGWLTKKFGLVRLTVLSLIGFVSFSWVCGISNSMTMLVVARFFQGLVAGPLIPTSQSLTLSIFPPEKKETALAFWSTVVIVAPVVGPMLGGWISYDISWSWIFFINIPIGLLAAFIIHLYLKPFETPKEKVSSDWMGVIFLVIGVSSLQYLLDKGEQFDWLSSPIIQACAAASIISFTLLIAWELTHPKPILNLRLFKLRSFSISIIIIATQYALYFGGIVLIPLWLQEYMGYTPIWAGIAVAPLGLTPLLLSWAMGKLTKKVGPYPLLAISNLLFGIACFITSLFLTQIDLYHIAITRFLFSFGILFMIVPLFSLSLMEISQEKLPQATGIFHFVRAMFGGIGTSIFTTLWVRRSALHHANLSAQVSYDRPPVPDFFGKLKQLGIEGTQAWDVVNEFTTRQAAVLGLNDCFYLMGWIFIGLIAILLLGIKRKSPYENISSSPSPSSHPNANS
ncbi:MAG: Multidrug export protein EmrB [Chlamydiae bacterium]|nr:Multidrug export protein EmrB [Chlamydiota bacterium]